MTDFNSGNTMKIILSRAIKLMHAAHQLTKEVEYLSSDLDKEMQERIGELEHMLYSYRLLQKQNGVKDLYIEVSETWYEFHLKEYEEHWKGKVSGNSGPWHDNK